MAETGENYTTARRTVIAGRDPGQPAVVVRVYLNPQVDVELTAAAARAYAAADEARRRELAGRLLADRLEGAGAEEAQVVAGSKIVTDSEPRTAAEADADADAAEAEAAEAEAAEADAAEAAEDAAIRGAVQRAAARAVGVSAVDVGRTADRLRVDIRAVRPILVAGQRGEEADRLRGELEELTGRRVRLDIREAPAPE
jgi:hypothetical protein